MSKFLSQRLSSLEEYVPGEQPRDKKYIKLNTNESPFPPSKKAIKAVNKTELSDLRLYSDPECKLLKEEIAKYYGVKSENVFVSNGSDEALNFFFMAFCDNENKVCFPDISYGFYKVFADLYSLKYEEIPLKDDFAIDINDYIAKGSNIVIANPNAPTGIALTIEEIEKIVSTNPDNVVVIDEAYVDFGGESAVELTKKYSNLMVVQTFSKSRSLAGARLGFAIADSEIIKDLEKIKYSTNPYNINRLTLILGREAIADKKYFNKNIALIKEAREYTENELARLGFTVLKSKANFVFAKSDRVSGEKIYTALKERGILVRHFTKEKIKDFNRITIGTLKEMQSLISAIEDIFKSEAKK
jgi:histidinol-phosphate aminotransferase